QGRDAAGQAPRGADPRRAQVPAGGRPRRRRPPRGADPRRAIRAGARSRRAAGVRDARAGARLPGCPGQAAADAAGPDAGPGGPRLPGGRQPLPGGGGPGQAHLGGVPERTGALETVGQRPLARDIVGGMRQEDIWDAEAARRYDTPGTGMFAPEVLDPAVRRLAELAGGGRALEFAIGTGLVAVPLAESGVSVTGIELSRPMIDQLRTKADAETIPVIEGDMATARAPGTYTLVYLVFN